MKLLLKIKNGTPPMRKVRLVVILITSACAFVFSFVFRLFSFFTCLSMDSLQNYLLSFAVLLVLSLPSISVLLLVCHSM